MTIAALLVIQTRRQKSSLRLPNAVPTGTSCSPSATLPNTSAATLLRLLTNPGIPSNLTVSSYHPSADPDVHDAILTMRPHTGPCADTCDSTCFDYRSAVSHIAGHSQNPDVLHRIATTSGLPASIYISIARNRQCTPDTLPVLVENAIHLSDWQERAWLLHHVIAHPDTSSPLITSAYDLFAPGWYRNAVAFNTNTPHPLLTSVLNEASSQDLLSIAKDPRTEQPALKILIIHKDRKVAAAADASRIGLLEWHTCTLGEPAKTHARLLIAHGFPGWPDDLDTTLGLRFSVAPHTPHTREHRTGPLVR